MGNNDTNLKLANVIFDLAKNAEESGKYEDAIKSYKEVLNVFEQILGIDNERTKEVYSNIGMCYKALENNEEALNYLTKALSNSNATSVVQKQEEESEEELEKAKYKEMFKNAESVFIGIYDVNDEEGANRYLNRANELLNQEKYNDAITCYNCALEFYNKVHGFNNKDSAYCYTGIAVCYSMKEDNSGVLARTFNTFANANKGLVNIQKAIGIYDKVLDNECVESLWAKRCISHIYRQLEKWEEAMFWCTKAINIGIALLGDKSMDTNILVYWDLAISLTETGKFDEALKTLNDVLTYLENSESETKEKNPNKYTTIDLIDQVKNRQRKAQQPQKDVLEVINEGINSFN
jgi:tetratricopeptide (TPR) repeat protein